MATGTIKTIRSEKGFGFIQKDNEASGNGNIFFHMSAVEEARFDDLREGQSVSFEEGRDPRDPSRLRASNVRLLTAPATEE
jgi:CspA family cold shock protein